MSFQKSGIAKQMHTLTLILQQLVNSLIRVSCLLCHFKIQTQINV